ncbi:MAG: Fic family protein [Oscillospiraceae bacterium]|nr:Fic family protein [Oscillospiraceae bacterium]
MYEDKYKMTVKQNIFVAKRNIVDYIWKSANLEGIKVTYPETQQLYDGGNVAHLRVDEIVTINNLKHAWQFVLNSIDKEIDLNYICSINALVGSNLIDNAGNLRNHHVKIGGTSWRPELPIKSKVEDCIEEARKIKNSTEQAITLMCTLMRLQVFSDGNKRTSMLAANHEMIKSGTGIITIPIESRAKFGEKLVKYYETNDMKELKDFIYNECIDGIDF